MKKIITLFTITALIFSSCNIFRALKTSKHLGKVDFNNNNYFVEIPFELNTGHLLVKVEINKKSKKFFLDTGAPTAVSPDLTKECNFKVLKNAVKSDSIAMTCPFVNEINIGGLLYSNVGAIEVNTKEMFSRSCDDIDGLIGANIMSQNIWQIDYQQNKIRITDSLSKLNYLDKAIKIPFEISSFSKSPIITLKLDNGQSISLIFDTGSNGFITFNTDNKKQFINSFNQQSISEFYTKGYNSILGKDVAEQKDTAYLINTNLYFGSDTIFSQSLTYGRYKNYSEKKNGVIGNEFLKSYIVTFDWTTKTVFLYKYKEQNKIIGNFGFNYGFVNNKLFVGSIYKNSEAEKIGINIGDEIIEINGYTVAELTSKELCDYANDKFFLIPDEQNKATFVFNSKTGEIKTEITRN